MLLDELREWGRRMLDPDEEDWSSGEIVLYLTPPRMPRPSTSILKPSSCACAMSVTVLARMSWWVAIRLVC